MLNRRVSLLFQNKLDGKTQNNFFLKGVGVGGGEGSNSECFTVFNKLNVGQCYVGSPYLALCCFEGTNAFSLRSFPFSLCV